MLDKMYDLVAASGLGFIWFALIAVWGGTASYISRIRQSEATFSLFELIGEWTISAFAGIITAYICNEMQLSFSATAALSGIAGHMGGRAILMMEKAVEAAWRKYFGDPNENRTE